MQVVYICIFLLIGIVVYFSILFFLGKTVKRNAAQQTISIGLDLPVLPAPISEPKQKRRKVTYLNLFEQRKRRKLFRQSPYLFKKYGK
jgi:type III secretory pathway component EscT